MKRIIGIPISRKEQEKQPPPPSKPNLPDVIAKIDTRADDLDKKIAQCELELKKVSNRLKTLPEGAMKNTMKTKAYAILQRKKKFEEQAETFKQQSFNIAQTSGTIQSAKDTGTIVTAMKSAVKEIKKAQKKVDIDMIEELQDELEELHEKNEDIQNIFAHNLNMPIVDDQELEEQLELLGDELANDHDTSYLDDATGSTMQLKDKGQVSDNFNLPPGVNDLLNTSNSNDSFPPFNFNPSKPNSQSATDDNGLLNVEAPLINSQWDPLSPSSKKNSSGKSK